MNNHIWPRPPTWHEKTHKNVGDNFWVMILLRIFLRILIGLYKDFTNFYGFVKKMVLKNQYTYNVPPGSSAPASTTRPEGPSLRMGWMDGCTEYQKCPSNLFILLPYIEHAYTYLRVYSKVVTNILMGFKILCQVKITYVRVFFKNHATSGRAKRG